jgi:hypothetical protein
MQRSFKRDEEASFVMMVVEVLDVRDPKLGRDREDYWIRELKGRVEEGGFNMKHGAGFNVMSDTTIALMRRLAYERRNLDYRFKTPDGEVVKVDDLDAFCAERGLTAEGMRRVFRGIRHSHRGYTRHDSDHTPKNSLSRVFISPEGIEYTTTNLTRFAKEHNLSPSNVVAVASGRFAQCKGWRLKGDPIKRKPNRKRIGSKGYGFTAPDGKNVHFTDMTSFCEGHGLNRGAMYAVHRGEAPSHKGYVALGSSFVPRAMRKGKVS